MRTQQAIVNAVVDAIGADKVVRKKIRDRRMWIYLADGREIQIVLYGKRSASPFVRLWIACDCGDLADPECFEKLASQLHINL